MPQKVSRNTLIDLAVLVSITGFLLSYFTPEYLLSVNTATGGDTASHYYTAKYLKEYLLPNGKLTGWTQGNYAGFPILQFYFPLPFLIAVLLSYFVPLQIAFKLITVLGIFLLPICVYISLRLMRYRFPVPILGAVLTLPFLFIETNSMWGGNILSTLAGEFDYSFGLALSILFIGSFYNGITTGKHAFKNAFLIALIGLSHGYTLLFSGMVTLYFLFTTDFFRRLGYLIKVHVLGFMLMGFWIVPMIHYMPFTTHFSMIWKIHSLAEVFPIILLPLIGIALAGRLASTGRSIKKSGLRTSVQQTLHRLFSDTYTRTSYLWSCALISAFLYLTAYAINVIDIRFLPFMQLVLAIIAGVELGYAFRRFKAKWLTPFIILIAVVVWTDLNEKNIGNWVKWNYAGIENKADWPLFSGINNYLKGNPSDPRVVYEHSTLYQTIGTQRAFESLPLFSGRSTLEGLYLQSSPSSPFIFFLQSEISKEISCPFPDYTCSSLNLDRGIKHLAMFNVRDFIVRSDTVKAEILKYPEFVLKKSFGPYEIYELTSNENRYVVPLKYEPVLYRAGDWKSVSYRWFKNMNANDVHLVFAGRAAKSDSKKFKAVFKGGDFSSIPKIPVEGDCKVAEELKNEEINIRTDCINKPLLVKVSYHPRWRVEGARNVYLASPSFMLIFPERENVSLRFSMTGVEKTGNFMTLFAVFTIIISPVLYRTGITNYLGKYMPGVSLKTRLGLRAKGLIVFIIAFVLLLAGLMTRINNPDNTFVWGMDLYNRNKFSASRYFLNKTITALPDSTIAREATYYYAVTYFLERDYKKAIESFQKLANNFPESHWAAEAYYHIGLSYTNLKNNDKAVEAFRFIIANYSATVWAEFSQDKLSKLSGPPAEKKTGNK